MYMKKRILSIVLILATIFTMTLCLSACSKKDGNYPVTIGHTEISEKPENVAVLSDNLADMLLYMDGYLSQICAISDSCTQTELNMYIDSVGSETNPSVDALVKSGAEYVLTDIPLSDTIKKKLADNDITVLNFMVPETDEQLATIYGTLGAFFGGKSGKEAGKEAYERLMNTITTAANTSIDSNTLSLCYLYLNDNGNLCTIVSNSCYAMVLNYLDIPNISGIFNSDSKTISTGEVNTKNLKLANPVYIFYDNAQVLEYLKNDPELSTLQALTENNTCELPMEKFNRFGETLISTQQSMLNFIYSNLPDDVPVPDNIPQPQAVSYAEDYGINIEEADSYQNGDEAEEIRIIQQRLVDLEYLVFDEGDQPTTTFGGMTEAAVREFQTANGLEATGIVNWTTLDKLFLSTTLSKSGSPVEPPAQSTPATQPDSSDTPSTTAPAPDTDKVYDIVLSEDNIYGANVVYSEDVAVIQERLHDLGFYNGDYTTYYGTETTNAFKAFEEANGLEANGLADYDDLKVLFPNN